MKIKAIIFASFLFSPFVSNAMYKCIDADGKITYSQIPCASNADEFSVNTRPPTPTDDPRYGFACDDFRNTCAQMTSCTEAMFFLEVCGVRILDADSDGVACERTHCSVGRWGAYTLRPGEAVRIEDAWRKEQKNR